MAWETTTSGVALDGVGAQGGAHLAHEGGGARAVALDVADDEGDVVVGQRDHVVPVAAEFEAGRARQVAGDGDRAGQFGQAAWQQLALEHADEFVLGVEGVGAHQGLPGEARGGGEQGAFVGAEVVRGVPADETGAGHAADSGQRQHGEASGADLGEGGFQGGAGGPDLGAALAQGGGEGGHGADGRVGPFGAPLGAPQLGPELRFGRVEDGDDEPVALQLGEGDPVGPQRSAQGGDDGLADVTDGARDGEGGGQALDPGHVGDVGAQCGGVGDSAHEPCRAAVAAGQEMAAQPEPSGWSGGLQDPELEFALADGHVVGLHHGHQRGEVLRHGQGEQGLDLAVELVGADPEQLQDLAADLDAAGVHGEAEGARGQLAALGSLARGRDVDGVGDQFEALAAVGVEAGRVLADREQAGRGGVAVRGEGRQVELPRGCPPGLGAGRELLGAEPHGPCVAQGVGRRGAAGAGVGVAQPVQPPGHAGRLDQAELVAALARGVHGGEGRTREDERLFEDATQPFG